MASNTISILIKAKDEASRTIGDVNKQLDKASDSADKSGSAFSGARGNLAAFAAAAGAAVMAAGGFAIKAGADYERSLNVFQSVSGASADQMKRVADTARALGKDMTLPGVSAKDAALAMVELAKAGLNVNDTLGASKGVLALAKAGNLDTAQAAEIAASALNAFNLKGTEATRVADLLAAAANASSADVTDMAYAMQMSSASAAAVKVPVQDLTTAIAQMANNGIKGSDAGTSLKTMFNALTPTTTKAKEAMKRLSLDFYDAKGNFVGMREVVRQLEAGTKGLTDEQKSQAIETIFGSDAMRAANVLLKEGVAGYDKMSGAVQKQGAAAELAAAQNAGFWGAWDALKSNIETAAIDLSTRILPGVTGALIGMGQTVSDISPLFFTWLDSTIPKLQQLGREIWDYLGPKLAALGAAIRDELIPILSDLWHNVLEPLIPVIGDTLVAAFGLVVDIITGTIEALGFVYQKVLDGDPVWTGLITTLGLVAGALAMSAAFNAFNGGMAFIQTVTIPAVAARFAALAGLIASPILMPALVIAAALASLYQVVKAVDAVKGAVDALNNAAASKAAAIESENDAIRRIQASNQPAEWKARKINEIRSASTRAMGGPVASGTTYLVGERGPEYFTPSTSGRITPGGGGGTTVNINGTINISTPEAADAFWNRIDKTQRLAAVGMA
jgi:TP901 family phage tail tape measure protein